MKKCVFIVDKTLPLGLVANTCAVLSLSLGKNHPELVGDNLHDKDGNIHAGITTVVMPVLGIDGAKQHRHPGQRHLRFLG